MGKAVIVEDKGFGLYSVRLDYDLTTVNAEIDRLEAVEAAYFVVLLQALNTLDDLRRTKAEAAAGLNEVIDQWKAALISKLNEEPPAIIPDDPIDPETGLPWADTDRAQDGPLFTAINAERASAGRDALVRADALDAAILRHLRYAAGTGQTTHYDSEGNGAARARKAGYNYDLTIGVGQVQSFGQRTAAATVAYWMRTSDARARILNAAYTECGVGYVYAPKTPYTYLWGAIFATPGAPLPDVDSEADPAEQAAKDADSALERITLPTIETFEPDKLGVAAAELAKASQRVSAAEREVIALQVESINRHHRIALLNQVKSRSSQVFDAWATRPPDFLGVGDTTDTAQIPGFFVDDPQPKTRTFTIELGSGIEFTRSYDERPINLIPPSVGMSGQIRPTQGMTPSAAFFAAAIEPGWARWRPLWRYGTITAKTGNLCSLTLENRDMREIRGAGEVLTLDAPENISLTNVPISYPPCDGDVFITGDEVLVLFEGQNRDAPKVIGFKFAPRVCPGGRMSWKQLR